MPPSTPFSAAAPSFHGTRQNTLLKALPDAELGRLFQHLELITLPFGKKLFEFGAKIEFAYFPANAIVSLFYVMEDGASSEVAVVGSEGVVGFALYASERASFNAVVQSAGYAYRLNVRYLREFFKEGGTLARLLMAYSTAFFAQMTQNVVGARHCSIEQKVCRWLLDRLDRTSSPELKVTQDAIANMLGVRRESVTAAARKLQAQGMIVCRRGHVMILDRARLEAGAGSCYTVARAAYEQMRQQLERWL